jgi:hypothetical protein
MWVQSNRSWQMTMDLQNPKGETALCFAYYVVSVSTAALTGTRHQASVRLCFSGLWQMATVSAASMHGHQSGSQVVKLHFRCAAEKKLLPELHSAAKCRSRMQVR